jgi:hypothetical protein
MQMGLWEMYSCWIWPKNPLCLVSNNLTEAYEKATGRNGWRRNIQIFSL